MVKVIGYLKRVEYINDISIKSAKNTGLKLGEVLDIKKSLIKLKLLEDIDMLDGIEIHGKNTVSTVVTCIRDDKFNLINSKKTLNNIVWIGDINLKVDIGDNIYKTSNVLNKKYIDFNKKIDVNISFNFSLNENISFVYNNTKYFIDEKPNVSINKSITNKDIIDHFSKHYMYNFN
ncbi:MAG: hypothetical protein RSF67_02980, partial [Clostridia bacterium]